MAVYLPRMAQIWLKLDQNATIPDISFFDAQNETKTFFLQTLIGRLPPEDGSDGAQTFFGALKD